MFHILREVCNLNCLKSSLYIWYEKLPRLIDEGLFGLKDLHPLIVGD